MANLRQKNDPINGATGACAAGFLAGLRSMFPRHCLHASDIYKVLTERSIPSALGGCLVLGAVVGGYDYAGRMAGSPGISLEEKRKRFFKPNTPIPEIPTASTSE